jgi:hypothetical protein
MGLRVIGAGLGRTGTMSLKFALERLLGGPCYHMIEVRRHDGHIDAWRLAALGEPPDWHGMFDGYVAAVDWPMAPFWRPLAEAFPDAIILHSTRSDAATWFDSAASTIFRSPSHVPDSPFEDMWQAVAAMTFDGPYDDREVAIAGYERHNADVVATAPPDRLVRYRPGDGWEPLCSALDLAVPDEPFPHTNTTAEFRARAGIDD